MALRLELGAAGDGLGISECESFVIVVRLWLVLAVESLFKPCEEKRKVICWFSTCSIAGQTQADC